MRHCRSNGLANHKQNSMVSPLVDVVFNLMITMFVFLLIYIAAVIPKAERHLDFEPFYGANVHGSGLLNVSALSLSMIGGALAADPIQPYRLPDATVYGDYRTNIPVRNGEGRFSFIISASAEPVSLVDSPTSSNIDDSDKSRVSPDPKIFRVKNNIQTLQIDGVGVIELNTHTGLLKGRFFNTGIKRNGYAEVIVYVTVVGKKFPVPKDLCEKWGEIGLNFYKQVKNSNDESISVPCRRSIQGKFLIRVYEKNIPYVPEQRPLKLANTEQTIEFVAGYPLEEEISVFGGIEPYEFRLSGDVPGWLRLSRQEGHKITAKNPQPGKYILTIEVKDAQIPIGNWNAARRAKEAGQVGNPYQKGQITLKINEPLSGRLHLPDFSRIGSKSKGSVILSGGAGQRQFEPIILPPGLTLDETSGEIRGTPTALGKYPVEVKITDNHSSITVKKVWVVIGPKPQAKLVIKR